MPTTFGERLRIAMQANGIRTPAGLSQRCGGAISRQTARHWLAMKEAKVEADALATVAACLGFRLVWLIGEVGPMYAFSPELLRAGEILAALSPAKTAKWLRDGERLAEG